MGMVHLCVRGVSLMTNGRGANRQFMSGLSAMLTERRFLRALAVAMLLLAALSACQKEPAITAGPSFEVLDLSIADLQAALREGRITSRELVERYLTRIQQNDAQLKAIIAVNPRAREDADRLDRERAAGKVRGP